MTQENDCSEEKIEELAKELITVLENHASEVCFMCASRVLVVLVSDLLGEAHDRTLAEHCATVFGQVLLKQAQQLSPKDKHTQPN